MRHKELFAWMQKRQAIYEARRAGKPKPWTKDLILRQYRFCNVFRELDAVTVWIKDNWRAPNHNDPNLWFAMVVARLFNLPNTLQAIGYPVPYQPIKIYKATEAIRASGSNIFNGAYIVSTNGIKQDKVQYLVQRVLTPLWDDRKKITVAYQNHGSTLAHFHSVLQQYQGLGSFMAAQVVADLKYVGPLNNASDWHMFAASGPGSRRGLNRVCDVAVTAPWREATWHANLLELKAAIDPLVAKAKFPSVVHAQDLQNCLCEFDKYERVQLGEGRPKSKYPGGA